ncbi:MAG: TIGR04282 family arsenosugar biosynthesis glycosyltransferase [Planctomycetes bacterium]|nr:TIGR04282 family arsenosugar biosynthesis glycosyltransferase [Planctomycetota bacterium]
MAPTLAVFAKAPLAGQVKTRLARTIGDDDALAVYLALLDRTAQAVSRWTGDIITFVSGDPLSLSRTALRRHPTRPQTDGGLGARLLSAVNEISAPCVIIGADCPSLTAEHLGRLAGALSNAPIAFGPAHDGGYWGVAIADRTCAPIIFSDDLPWSQPELLTETRARLTRHGVAPALVDTLDDLDDADDLRRAEASGFDWRSFTAAAWRSA